MDHITCSASMSFIDGIWIIIIFFWNIACRTEKILSSSKSNFITSVPLYWKASLKARMRLSGYIFKDLDYDAKYIYENPGLAALP